MHHWELALYFLGIAFINSMVGFAGRGSYVALMNFYHIPFEEASITSLICSVVVAGVCSFTFFDISLYKRVTPLVLVSIPLYLVGYYMRASVSNGFIVYLLGGNLLIISVLLWTKFRLIEIRQIGRTNPYIMDGLIGGYIGFLSSLLGVGGGFFLVPILFFRKWEDHKKIASAACLFILVNSVCAFFEHMPYLFQKDCCVDYPRLLVLLIAVFIGGYIGAKLSIKKLNANNIRKISAALIFLSGIEILTRYLPLFK